MDLTLRRSIGKTSIDTPCAVLHRGKFAGPNS